MATRSTCVQFLNKYFWRIFVIVITACAIAAIIGCGAKYGHTGDHATDVVDLLGKERVFNSSIEAGFIDSEKIHNESCRIQCTAEDLRLDVLGEEYHPPTGVYCKSARESYGDSAIGYVQVKRDGGKCSVMAKITPEHKLKVKPYTVIVIVDEDEEIIEGANCYGCAAAVGGCKHSIAFLMWLHRRSEEPSSTEVENYWKKSKLSTLGSEIMKVRDMTGAAPLTVVEEGSFRKKVIAALAEEGEFESGLMSLNYCLNVTEFSIPQLLASFRERADEEVSALSFLNYAESLMREQNLCDTVFKSTLAQYESPLWHQLRLGRISASRAYDAMHCRKKDGVLVDMILGARKVGDTPAMKRGRELESKVVEELEKKLGGKINKCGLILNPDYPFMAASPDGVIGETLVEIKCPMKDNRQQYYMVNGSPTVKYATQMIVQMLLSGRKECLYVVADPHFEHNKTLTTCLFQFDDEFCIRIVNDCREFWCNTIFPVLYK